MYVENQVTGWGRDRGDPSLADVHRTVAVRTGGSAWRRSAAFLGPGYLVAVGYMDPGNWATSLAGGSKFGYTLLFVALVSNIMAIILQALCARLAVASRRDHIDVHTAEASVAGKVRRIVGQRVLVPDIMRHLFTNGVDILDVFREVRHTAGSQRDFR